MFRTRLVAEDWFSRYTGYGRTEVLLPKAALSRAMFQDLPEALIGAPLPYVLGDFSTAASATPPPIWVVDAARGVRYEDGWAAGFGDHVSSAVSPTTVTPTATGGGALQARLYYVCVTAIDAEGREATPVPLLPWGAPVAASAGDRVDVAWSGGSGAVMYRCYLGVSYFGIHFHQYIETASTSCSFDDAPHFPGGGGGLATGATPVTGGAYWYYSIAAVMPDGETARSVEIVWRSVGITRPAYLTWAPVPGAIGYRLYKRAALPGSYFLRFDLGPVTDFTDDHTGGTSITGTPVLSGPVPLTYVGRRTSLVGPTMHAFLVSAGAITTITALYVNGAPVHPGQYGVDWMVPDKPGFAAHWGPTSYVDLAGQRMTLVYGRGPHGDAAAAGETVLSCTMVGLERAGDGGGDPLVDLADQYEFALRNLILRDVRTGPWHADGPTWGDDPIDVDLVDGDSFARVKERWMQRLAGGCPGAWILGRAEDGTLERQSVTTWLARLNQSLGVRATPATRKGQYAVHLPWWTPEEIADVPEYTAELGILKGTFAVRDHPERIENAITVRCALRMLNPEIDRWTVLLLEDADAQMALGGGRDPEVRPATLTLWCVRNQAVAYALGAERLARRRYAPREAEWMADMGGLTVDLGDVVRVTHPDGYGPLGFQRQPFLVARHEFEPGQLRILLTAEDLGWLVDPVTSAAQPPVEVGAVMDAALIVTARAQARRPCRVLVGADADLS